MLINELEFFKERTVDRRNMEGKAAVFTGVGKPIEIREYPLLPVKQGEVLVRISMCSVCGSDYHTWAGHRVRKIP